MKIKALMVILLLFSFSILSGCIKEKTSKPFNNPPVASLSVSPSIEGYAPFNVSFDVNGNDADGYIASWQLDVDGDGIAEFNGNGSELPKMINYTYSVSGDYTAKLIVIDNNGSEDISKISITVVELFERSITTNIYNFTIFYKEGLKYERKNFENILKNWSNISSHMIEKVIKRYSKQGIEIKAPRIYYVMNKSSVFAEFQVINKIWKNDDRYYADFLWLLNPFNLDFIDSKFKETNHGLFWSGKLNGVPTDINVLLPPQKEVYRAWQDNIGHCHGHVWWIK